MRILRDEFSKMAMLETSASSPICFRDESITRLLPEFLRSFLTGRRNTGFVVYDLQAPKKHGGPTVRTILPWESIHNPGRLWVSQFSIRSGVQVGTRWARLSFGHNHTEQYQQVRWLYVKVCETFIEIIATPPPSVSPTSFLILRSIRQNP
jgi:hypothetical protein